MAREPKMTIDLAQIAPTHGPNGPGTSHAPSSPTGCDDPSRVLSLQALQTFDLLTRNVHRDFARRISVADVHREIQIIRNTNNTPRWLSSWLDQTSERVHVLDSAPTVRVLSGRIEDVWPSKYVEYTLECQYQAFKWVIEIPKSSIYGLWFFVKSSTLTGFRHSSVVSSTSSANLSAQAMPATLPSMSRFFLANAEKSITNEMLLHLQLYINSVLSVPLLLSSPYVLSLLQVSCSTFDKEDGKTSICEGWLKVRIWVKGDKDNLRINHGAMSCDNECFNCMCVVKRFSFKPKKSRWVAIKHSCIVVYTSIDSTVAEEVFLFDPRVTIESGIQHVGSHCALLVSNSTYVMQLEAKSKQAITHWAIALRKTVDKCDWAQPQRDDSYAVPRSPCIVPSYAKWLVDGKAGYEAIYHGLLSAQREIFIAGWCLSPELHLRRPGLMHPESRLDRVLLKKAQEGVMIYVLIYKEITVALDLGSSYAKRMLRKLHPNVLVLRDPDFLVKQWGMWSHHEKIVSIDQKIAFVGGLDICFGRFDTASHVLFDNPREAPQMTKFIGKDYCNPRIRDITDLNLSEKDDLDRKTEPRMPWHDVHCRLEGQPARDVARHFIQRWNHSVSTRAKRGKLFPLVPRNELTGNLAAIHGDSCEHLLDDRLRLASSSIHSFAVTTFKKTPRVRSRISEGSEEEKEADKSPITQSPPVSPLQEPKQPELPPSSKPGGDVVVVSSSPATSHGLSSLGCCSSPRNGNRTQSRFFRDVTDQQHVCDDNEHCLSKAEQEKIRATRGFPCAIQICRSLSLWSGGCPTEKSIQNAYIRLISQANHFIYIENQFFVSGLDGDRGCSNRIANAIVERIRRAARNNENFRVMVVMPLLPSFPGNPLDKESSNLRGVMYWQYRSICRGNHSIYHALFKEIEDPFEYLAFYGLRKTQQNGLQPQTEEVYIHSKIMIVDDRYTIIGSANINERSMKGDRDSEIAAIIEDTEFDETVNIGGGLFNVGKFGHSLRMKLFEEHFGVAPHTPMYDRYKDPVSLETWFMLQDHAMKNTQIYEHVFGCIPSDTILTGRHLELEHTQKKHDHEANKTSPANQRSSISKLLTASVKGKQLERQASAGRMEATTGNNPRNINGRDKHNTPREGPEMGPTVSIISGSAPPLVLAPATSSSSLRPSSTPTVTNASSSTTTSPSGTAVLLDPHTATRNDTNGMLRHDPNSKITTTTTNSNSHLNTTITTTTKNESSTVGNVPNSEFGAAMNLHLRGNQHILETKNELHDIQGHIVYFPLKFLADEALEPKLFPAELYQ